MEPIQATPSALPASVLPPAAGELIVQNGRLSGTRRPLSDPLTLIGRATGCDVRLTVDGVGAQHCLVARTPAGLIVRDLGCEAGTQVNDHAVTTSTLQDGDILTVGPFRFLVRLPASVRG